jgi:uncharacterized iron-regulated membrane protein
MAGVGIDSTVRAGVWRRWVGQPHSLWLRRALFQIHLWSGLALGLYIVMLSLTGSILVFNRELNRFFATPGEKFSTGQWAVLWLARLHDELLLGRDGQWWNGVLSLAVTVLVFTGLVVWWPGVSRWRRSLGVRRSAGWRRFNWDLHSALGIWLGLFLLMWGVSGFYLGVPEPFTHLSEQFANPETGQSPGDTILAWLARLHFGRWRTMLWLRVVWAIIGLVPAIMFITGAVMWWNRVLRHRAL